MTLQRISSLQTAIRGETLAGWLFHNMHHRDKLSDSILELDTASTNSRPWFYLVPAAGEAVQIVSSIEANILNALPGLRLIYTSQAELKSCLRRVREMYFSSTPWGAHISSELPILSFLDQGTALLLQDCGFALTSAAGLIQRLRGILTPAGIESHERSARLLYAAVQGAWEWISGHFAREQALYEGDIRDFLLAEIEEQGLETDHPPIVAGGKNSADPHYACTGKGERIAPDSVIQLDIWAKETRAGAIYADISWVGFYGTTIPPQLESDFRILTQARDLAVETINRALDAGTAPTGAQIDGSVRAFLIGNGYEAALRHRTGHGIDEDCHGSGANLDSVEFPDERLLLEGSCFSVEPGIYLERYGLRTEIDVYIADKRCVISGGTPQRVLLDCARRT